MGAQDFKNAYASALNAFVKSPEERYLMEAAELGSELVRVGVPPEEIAEIHEEGLRRLAGEFPDKTLLESVQRISAPLMEMLMAYGLAFRKRADERERADKALRESEEHFRLAFDETPIGTALIGLDHRFLRVNKALCDMLGYTREKLLKLAVSDITHPEDIEKSVELTEKVFRGKISSYRLEKRYLTKAGDVVWVHLSATAVRDPDGNILYGLGMIEDISARKRAEQRQSLLASAVEQAAESIYITDAGGSIEYANPAFETVTGYSPNEVIRRRQHRIREPRLRNSHRLLAKRSDRQEPSGVTQRPARLGFL